MLIELPDNWMDFMKDMPAQGEAGADDKVRERNVLEWIKQCFYDGSPGLACVPMFIISAQIAERAEQLGLITFDPEARTWKGVRYGDDQFLHADGTADLHAPGEAGEGGQGKAGVL